MEHVVTIKGKKVEIFKFGAIEGWRLFHRISKILGPSAASIDGDRFDVAIDLLFRNLPEDAFIDLLKQLTSVCLIDGKKTDFNSDFGDYLFTALVCKEVLMHNFEDFFSPIMEILDGRSLLGKK